MRFVWLLCIGALLLAPQVASAFEGRYAIEGFGPEGAYQGTAVVERNATRRWRVVLKTLDSRANERRARASAAFLGTQLRFLCRASLGDRPSEATLRASLRALKGDRGSFVVTYRDVRNQIVRRECWVPDDQIRIPLTLVTLSGDPHFKDVTRAQSREAQARVLAQLGSVYGRLGVEFQPVSAEPIRLPGSSFDLDGDGRLSRAESVDLRNALEGNGIKRRGRVVLVITAAGIVREGCRGWTLGDADPSPDTLDDPNDNFSVIGLSYLDPRRHHTVAHEVGHQLGLDDLRKTNRGELTEPGRADHLMISGGTGLHLDSRVRSHLRETCSRFPDHGLEGRRPDRRAPVSPLPGLSVQREEASTPSGLPPPAFAPKRN